MDEFSIYFTNIADSLKESNEGPTTTRMTSHSIEGDLDYYTYTIVAESFDEVSELRYQNARKICDSELCITIIAFKDNIVNDVVKHVGL
jgi:hypothetical protein